MKTSRIRSVLIRMYATASYSLFLLGHDHTIALLSTYKQIFAVIVAYVVSVWVGGDLSFRTLLCCLG